MVAHLNYTDTAYIIDRRLYTYNGMQLLSYIKKVQYSIARNAWAAWR